MKKKYIFLDNGANRIPNWLKEVERRPKMSKAILISDKPKWCALMMNGIKKIEVRTNKALAKATQKLIEENGFAEFYVYCTKDIKQYVVKEIENEHKPNQKYVYELETKKEVGDYLNPNRISNGKVIFKFRCYKVEEISWQIGVFQLEQRSFSDFLNKCCLGFCEFKNYLNKKNGYAIHISDLEIFDRPKELSEFYKVGHHEDINDYFTDEKQINGKWCIPLTKAPQSFMYVEVEE